MEFPGPWWWRLSANVANPPKNEQLGDLGNLAKNTEDLAIFDGEECKVAKLPQLGNLGPELFGKDEPPACKGQDGLFNDPPSDGPYAGRY
jgi:hypothetical protein